MAASELVAMLTLAVSTAVAVTAVSIEIAQAETFGEFTGIEGSHLALATFLGLLITAMGGITVFAVGRSPRRE